MTPSFPVSDWEAIPLDTYKNVLLEIKEKFDTVSGEVVSCTDKSIKCLLAFITYIFGVGVFLITNHYELNLICYLVILGFSAYNVYLGYTVIRLRPSHTSGLLPENVLSVDFNANSGFSDDEKQKLFYYKAVLAYTQKVFDSTVDNTKRAKNYDTFFALTLLMVLIITTFVFYTISYPPLSARF